MWLSAIILGLLSSFHCIGMCGPIAFMLPVDRKNKIKQHLQIGSYHLGRLTTYSLFGVIFGILGKGFELFGFQQIISIIAGVLMILSVLLPKLFQKIEGGKWLSKLVIKLKSSLGNELKQKKNNTFFTIGFINGFLPCGMLYLAIFGAIAMHNPLKSSLYMFLYGLGTIPLMTAVIYLGNSVNTIFKNKIQKVIPIVVIIIGIVFILRGLELGIPYISPNASVSNLVEPQPECVN